MKHKLSIALGMVFCLASISDADTAKEVFEKVAPSVVLIMMENDKGQLTALGSGFVVADKIVASNLHVVKGAVRGKVKLVNSKNTFKIAGIVAFDGRRDLVLLEVPEVSVPALELKESSQVSVGDTVYAIGNPKGLEGTFSSGIVSGVRSVEGEKLFQITAPISPGSSGGPVVDEHSKVLGVASGTFRGGQSLNFVVPVGAISEMLKGRTQPIPLSSAAKSEQRSVLGAIGEPLLDAVGLRVTTNFWESRVSAQLGADVTCFFMNKSENTITHILFRVVFFDPAGAMMDFQDITFSEPIPPQLTRGMKKEFYFSSNLRGEKALKHLESCRSLEVRILDFRFREE